MMSESTGVSIIHTTGVGNCGGRCVLHAHVRNGEIIKLTTDDPTDDSQGVPLCACIKGLQYHKTFLGEDRLKYPLKRVGARGEGKFKRISWDEALDTIASEWVRIRDTYGVGARYLTESSGVCGVLSGFGMMQRLLNLDGGYLGSYNSYSSACIRKATPLMYGTNATGNHPSDWLSSHLIILWGHNPVETKFDHETMYYLRKARKAGIPIVVVDPRKSDTALALQAEWIPIRPATDAALMDAMAYVIYTESLHDQAFLDRCCIGFDETHMPEGIPAENSYLSYLLGVPDGTPKRPEWAEAITGVPAKTICDLARRYATAKPAALVMGYGPQRHAYGEQMVRGGILLACMTGNVGVSGGWASGTGDYRNHRSPRFPIGENPHPYSIPTYRWTDAVDHGANMDVLEGLRLPGGALPEHGVTAESDVKMIFNLAGNALINQHGDINRTAALLRDTSKCEFIVCNDIFMTASAKFADIVLPGVSMFETENITMPWAFTGFLGFSNKIIPPIHECREDYDWISALADRLGLKAEFTAGRTADQWLRYIYEELRETEGTLPDYDSFRLAGIHRYQDLSHPIAFENEVRDPERYPFPTESGKIEIFSRWVYQNQDKLPAPFPAIPRYMDPPEGAGDPLSGRYPLQLIGWHPKNRTHTVHDNNPALKAVEPQCVWMHPSDAARRDIRDGDPVLVRNDRGRIRLPARLTERIMPGVSAIAQGAWYAPDASGTDTGGSINVLTTQNVTPYAHGNPQHTNLVEIQRAPSAL